MAGRKKKIVQIFLIHTQVASTELDFAILLQTGLLTFRQKRRADRQAPPVDFASSPSTRTNSGPRLAGAVRSFHADGASLIIAISDASVCLLDQNSGQMSNRWFGWG